METDSATVDFHVADDGVLARILVAGADAATAPRLAAGAAVAVPAFSAAAFPAVAFAPGAATVQALAADGATVLASHSAASWGAPAALRLTVDAPSPRTGTGGALYLDGSDVALLRVEVLDAAGNLCRDAAANVTLPCARGRA